MIRKIGELIERVTLSVRQFGVDPHSEIVVREGDFGTERPIKELKVASTLSGLKLIIVTEPAN